ncbi:diguanylate cyclase [Ideonella sp. 4Y16]|uniref:diguanylate cyclase domain-containing protein n=1 Tax=Ideonella alba TaxID=2824118 RepID=UPI001B361C8E|nr:diguanylate cyclase [Ideonella alba]MBQ0942296.1 diguanylate cyclase [Ideonella alba]
MKAARWTTALDNPLARPASAWWRRWWRRGVDEAAGLLATDALTGLPDREGLLAQALALQVRARQRDATRPMGLLLIEFDDTPALVAQHGVTVAESAVRALSMALRRGIRQGDLIGRWAAGAFMVVLPPLDPRDLRMIGERLRAVAQATELREGPQGSLIPISVHVGASSAPLDEPLSAALARSELALKNAAPRLGRGERVSVVLR